MSRGRQKTIGIIPARLGSEEVHAKVLADLGGKPVIQHVYERTVAADLFDEILVAADHEQIVAAAQRFGARTYQTRGEHLCGTDRCAEAARALFPDADLVVNIQADEPFLNPQMIRLVVDPLTTANDWDIATLACPSPHEDERASPFAVKIARAASGQALYFSRAVIPFPRYPDRAHWLEHIGVYAYRLPTLLRFAALGPSPLELIEGLEQLRALEAGMRIQVVETPLAYPRVAIDTQADLDKALQLVRDADLGREDAAE